MDHHVILQDIRMYQTLVVIHEVINHKMLDDFDFHYQKIIKEKH